MHAQFLDTSAPDRRADQIAITEVCCRMNRWRVRWSIRPLCCLDVLVGTNLILALVTASQIASALADGVCAPSALRKATPGLTIRLSVITGSGRLDL